MRNYDKMMQSMTPEGLAALNVKLVSVDNRRLYYMTSSGQLYTMDNYGAALNHEFNWLMIDDAPEKNEPSPLEDGKEETNEPVADDTESKK